MPGNGMVFASRQRSLFQRHRVTSEFCVKSPAFQFYPGDWLSSAKIACMTLEQEGAYHRLLCYDWMKDGIPDDDSELASLSKMGEGWLKGGSTVLRKCFQPHPDKPGFLTNERLQQEREKQAVWREKSRKGGVNSAQLRASNNSKGGSRVVEFGSNQKATLQSSSSSSERESKNGHPDLEAVKLLCAKAGLPETEAVKFFHHYESNGWKVGKNKMVSLNGCVGGWAARWREGTHISKERQKKPIKLTDDQIVQIAAGNMKDPNDE